jgi:hypothetical protein
VLDLVSDTPGTATIVVTVEGSTLAAMPLVTFE